MPAIAGELPAMNDPQDLPAESPAPRRHRWGCFVVCLLLSAGLLLVTCIYLSMRGEHALQEAIDETDKLDPNWRLGQLDKQRVQPPDKDNAALQVQVAGRLLPNGWANTTGYSELFQEVPPEAQLNNQQIGTLKAELQKVAKARDEARKLAEMPDGYFSILWTPDAVSTAITGIQEVREVTNLLREDALLRAQEKDVDGAMQSLKAAIQAGRSLDDVPWTPSQLARLASVWVGAVSLERVLAQGEPSPAVLADLQHVLEEENKHSYLLVMARGERATLDQCITWLESGNATPSTLGRLTGGRGTADTGMAVLMNLPGEMRREHATLLRYMNQEVEAAKLPEMQQKKRLDEMGAGVAQQTPLVRLLLPAMNKLADADRRTHAQIRCAIVMLAAECYRRAHNRWPESVSDLVKDGFLGEIPTDPYDGAPVRIKRVENALVIYTVGPDGQDNGGTLEPRNRMLLAPGTDLGVHLWDVEQRRRPPLPIKPEANQGDLLPGGGRQEGGPPDQ
jgi:hypothetical protein